MALTLQLHIAVQHLQAAADQLTLLLRVQEAQRNVTLHIEDQC